MQRKTEIKKEIMMKMKVGRNKERNHQIMKKEKK
jgi:hypothetical protein